MEICKGMRIIDLGIFIQSAKALVISDLQLGYEESINRQGILLPRFQFRDIITRLSKIIAYVKPKILIFNGDLKHEFSTISRTEWKQVSELIEILSPEAQIVIIEGNHDNMLRPILKSKGLEMKKYLLLEKFYICHGHEIPNDADFDKADYIIIGHEHPAIGFFEKGRKERFKCFLKGNFRGKTLIAVPSFNMLTVGTDVLSEKLLSPFLRQGVEDFEVFVPGKKTLHFGKIKDIRKTISDTPY